MRTLGREVSTLSGSETWKRYHTVIQVGSDAKERKEWREDFSCTHVNNPGRNLNPREMGRSEGLNTS